VPAGIPSKRYDGVFSPSATCGQNLKRVAAAVGEGAQAVAALHAYLAGDKQI
jgi:thioredoxin reductase